jgi:hypothetical protein
MTRATRVSRATCCRFRGIAEVGQWALSVEHDAIAAERTYQPGAGPPPYVMAARYAAAVTENFVSERNGPSGFG